MKYSCTNARFIEFGAAGITTPGDGDALEMTRLLKDSCRMEDFSAVVLSLYVAILSSTMAKQTLHITFQRSGPKKCTTADVTVVGRGGELENTQRNLRFTDRYSTLDFPVNIVQCILLLRRMRS